MLLTYGMHSTVHMQGALIKMLYRVIEFKKIKTTDARWSLTEFLSVKEESTIARNYLCLIIGDGIWGIWPSWCSVSKHTFQMNSLELGCQSSLLKISTALYSTVLCTHANTKNKHRLQYLLALRCNQTQFLEFLSFFLFQLDWWESKPPCWNLALVFAFIKITNFV